MKSQGSKNSNAQSGAAKGGAGGLAAILAAVSSSLIVALVALIDDDDDGSRYANRGSSTTNIEQFITASTREKVVDLSGKWRFATGDDAARAEPAFDDGAWGLVSVPEYWENEGLKNYDGFAWYRRDFSLSAEDAAAPLYAYLGRIDDIDEVFVNGQRIGGQGRFEPYLSAWERNRIYRVPDGLLRADRANTISVRVLDGELGGGIYAGPVGLYRSELPQPLLDLSGDWLIRAGDDPTWRGETLDESGFRSIQVPMTWEAEGMEDYDGYAWYRKSFSGIRVSDLQTLVLVLGKIDDTDEVFLNGEMIGKTGELDGTDRDRNPGYYKEERAYRFSSALLKDSNVLAVRVHDSGGLGGVYSGPVGILAEADYLEGVRIREEAGKVSFGDAVDWLLGRD